MHRRLLMSPYVDESVARPANNITGNRPSQTTKGKYQTARVINLNSLLIHLALGRRDAKK